jgi:FkbM family methyltransferase
MPFGLRDIVRGPLLQPLNESARRLLEILDPFVNLAYSQDGEDMVLRRLLEGRAQGFYVDVGAHHPCRFSNTFYFYRRGWRGINIDANPNAIDAFRRERASDINLCLGIGDVSWSLSFHFFNEPALNTFDASLAAERTKLPGYRLIEVRDIPVRRLDDVLSEHLRDGQQIDFMSVDVEGMDLAVLRSNDWTRFRPSFLLAEALAAKLDDLVSDPICSFARSVGYRPIAKTANTIIFAEDHRSCR